MVNKIKSNYKTSRLAEEDLLNIFLKGIENFGIKKAQQYSLEIDKTFNLLAEYPDMGKLRDELFSGALSFSVGSHIVFYRKNTKTKQIEISRILHRRMDYEKYFD